MGFEPTQLALVELESNPLDHSGKLSSEIVYLQTRHRQCSDFGRGVVLGTAGPYPDPETSGGSSVSCCL